MQYCKPKIMLRNYQHKELLRVDMIHTSFKQKHQTITSINIGTHADSSL